MGASNIIGFTDDGHTLKKGYRLVIAKVVRTVEIVEEYAMAFPMNKYPKDRDVFTRIASGDAIRTNTHPPRPASDIDALILGITDTETSTASFPLEPQHGFECPVCGADNDVEQILKGAKVKCERCGIEITVDPDEEDEDKEEDKTAEKD